MDGIIKEFILEAISALMDSRQTMSKVIPILRGATGLNTVDDPVRIGYNSKTGISDLAVAINVFISPTGRINRRTGKTLRVPMDSHSLFCDNGEAVFVSESNLYLLETNFLYRSLVSLSSNDRMSYVQVGNRIYFTNNTDLGYIENGIAYTWSKTTDYVGPVTQKSFTGPFPGHHLAYHGGRIYIAKDNILWWSEYAAYDWYDMARNFIPFNTKILMIKPVTYGLFVSTEKAIYFLKGLVPQEFTQNKLTTYPVLEWSEAIDYVDGSNISGFEVAGLCAMWSTSEGAHLGTSDGFVVNLNKKKVIYPNGTKGSSLLRGLNFIHTIE